MKKKKDKMATFRKAGPAVIVLFPDIYLALTLGFSWLSLSTAAREVTNTAG